VAIEPEQTEGDFQRELVELFGQEARDWLVQIDSALTELQSQPDLDRHTQLVDAVMRGITSLGGSAATVNLSDVERTTFALLPFIDTLKDRTTATKEDYVTVYEQFRVVILSVTTATGITLELGALHKAPLQSEPTSDLLTLLNSLRALQDTNVGDPSFRSLIPQVMQRLEQEARLGTTQIRGKDFHRILLDLQSADEQLLQSLREELPAVTDGLSRLRREGTIAYNSNNAFGSCIPGIEHLQGIAKQANATSLVTFLTGLQSLLSLIIHRHVVLEAHRLESVEARIRAVLLTIEGWIAVGNRERDAMGRLLPTS
jgi:hypothetical protein